MTDTSPTEAPREVEPADSLVLPFPKPVEPEGDPRTSFVEKLALLLAQRPAWGICASGSRLCRGTELPNPETAQALAQRLFATLLTQDIRYELQCIDTWLEVRLPCSASPSLLALLETLETQFLLAERPRGFTPSSPLPWREPRHGA
jgi:hypothetical protein